MNGVEIARANLGSPGSQITFDKSSDSDHEAKMYGGSSPDQFEIQNISQFLVEGKNVLTIEIHNASESSSDMTVIPFFSFGYSSFSGIPYVNPLLNLPSSSLHTNFKLSKGGEFLGLFDADGSVIDTLTFEESEPDVSYGRNSETPSNWGFFPQPTPNQKNEAITYDFAKKPEFITQGGFYLSSQQVIIEAKNNNDQVYYTFDGTPPTNQSTLYSGPNHDK